MIRFTFQKLVHKKWLNLCTFLGMILLIGIAVGNTLYEGAALNRVLQTQFDTFIGEKNQYPVKISVVYPLVYEEGQTLSDTAGQAVEEMRTAIVSRVGMNVSEEVLSMASESLHCIPQYKADESKQEHFFIPTHLTEMEFHTQILKAEMYSV